MACDSYFDRSLEKLAQALLRLQELCHATPSLLFAFKPMKRFQKAEMLVQSPPLLDPKKTQREFQMKVTSKPKSMLAHLIVTTAIVQAIEEHSPFLKAQFGFDNKPLSIGKHADSSLFFCCFQPMIAERIQLLIDQIEDAIQDQKKTKTLLLKAAKKICQEQIQNDEAPSLKLWLDRKTIRALEGVLSEQELNQYYELMIEKYVYQKEGEISTLDQLVHMSEHPLEIETLCSEIKIKQMQMLDFGFEAKAMVYQELLEPKLHEIQLFLEENGVVLWPLQ